MMGLHYDKPTGNWKYHYMGRKCTNYAQFSTHDSVVTQFSTECQWFPFCDHGEDWELCLQPLSTSMRKHAESYCLPWSRNRSKTRLQAQFLLSERHLHNIMEVKTIPGWTTVSQDHLHFSAIFSLMFVLKSSLFSWNVYKCFHAPFIC